MRPEVGTQARFTKKQPPKAYRYDSSLSPALDYDGQNHAREMGEWLLRQIQEAAALPAPHVFPERRTFQTAGGKVACTIAGLQDAAAALASLSNPLLNWAGKAERLSFDVPTMPLFVHERLSTKAILETIRGTVVDARAGDLNYNTVAPWTAWGPYLWADGLNLRSDGLNWLRSDFETDGTHPSQAGEQKLGTLRLSFFESSPYTKCWFINGGTCP